jgi:RNA-binding protein
VHVGHQGITATVLQSLDDALQAHELVKIQVERHAPLSAKQAAQDLAEQVGADVVQVIGRRPTLYRHNPDLKRKADGTPPWR